MCGATSQRPVWPHTASALQLGSLLITGGHALSPQRSARAASNPAIASLRIAICFPLDIRNDESDNDTQITMKRLEVCLRQRMAGAPWDQAIRVALETVPSLAA